MVLFRVILCMALCSLAGTDYAYSDECEGSVVFEGKGAGQVVYDAAVHAAKGYSCAECHESRGFSRALFDMKRGGDAITMRKMELGYSCGHCHNGQKAFAVTDPLSCERCHHK